MLSFLKNTLVFLGFVDSHDGNLNKTGLMLYIVFGFYIYKMATATPAPLDTTGLLLVIIQALGKKAINAGVPADSTTAGKEE